MYSAIRGAEISWIDLVNFGQQTALLHCYDNLTHNVAHGQARDSLTRSI